jgi:hypothetical protein
MGIVDFGGCCAGLGALFFSGCFFSLEPPGAAWTVGAAAEGLASGPGAAGIALIGAVDAGAEAAAACGAPAEVELRFVSRTPITTEIATSTSALAILELEGRERASAALATEPLML